MSVSRSESKSVREHQESCSRVSKEDSPESIRFLSATVSAHMSAASSLRSEDQFLCSICLDVFTDPVSTPCGHNFCKNCITQYWDTNQRCQCPMCNETFNTRPHLRVNTFISEMVAQFKCEVQQKASSSSSEQQAAKPGEVPCDICTGTRLKALKSCLVCQESYCQTHLEPHLTKKGLKKHQLIEAVEKLEGRMCKKHDKPLELFCKSDQTCVCMLCSVSDHKNHKFIPLREEYEGKKAELEKTEAEIQQMIQKRRLKIQQIKVSVKMSKCAADRQKAEGAQVFTALKESVDRGLKELIKEIEDKQETTEKQAEGLIKDLKQEISELKKRSSEVEQLSHSEGLVHFLQSFSSLKAAPPTKNWTEVSIHPPSYEGTVVRAVAQLEETLRKLRKQETTEKQAEGLIKDLEQEISELKKRSSEVEQLSHFEDHLHLLQSFSSLKAAQPTKDWTEVSIRPPSYEGTVVRAVDQLEETLRKLMKKKLPEAELKKVQQYAVDVTLDPDTANPYLILSDDGKQVYHSDVKKKLPDNPKRFTRYCNILGKQSFSSGRFYFEVQVKGKTKWDLGVARESINRRGKIPLSPQNGFWTVWLRNGNEYNTLDDTEVPLCLQPGPEKVGVFVDYEEGLVSFYDVGAAALIYSFTGCSFTHKLHPYFSPCSNDGGKNSAPLIICPVNQTESINKSCLMN
uniref:E3 ubiquitin-protein ligase TRIM21-like n=1 Tax=Oreochromis niloticus TaxID=8128 RepID=A0A669E9M0_ORENI